jgi:uncharacterized protein (TIGR02246 family)
VTTAPALIGDVRALSATLLAIVRGYEQLDAAMICQMFDEDGEWVDTGGRHFCGRAQVRTQLSELFASGWVPADAQCVQPIVTARLLQPDIAVARVSSSVRDHSLTDRTENESLGRLHRLLVLRWAGARWLVTTEFALDDGTHNHASASERGGSMHIA